jgi:hypothetical protein
MKIEDDERNFLFAIFIAAIITYILTFIEIWQLIIIPGVVAGIINYKRPRKGIYSGALGVLISWTLYILIAFMTRNTYPFFDQFAGLIFGDLGYGWVVLILVILLGILFGALGGAIGSGITLYISLRKEGERETPDIIKPTKKSPIN